LSEGAQPQACLVRKRVGSTLWGMRGGPLRGGVKNRPQTKSLAGERRLPKGGQANAQVVVFARITCKCGQSKKRWKQIGKDCQTTKCGEGKGKKKTSPKGGRASK